MSHQTLIPSPLKEDRRILGEKNTNACLSPARSPTKQALLNVNSLSPTKKLLPSPSFTAQKRSIGQVKSEDATARVLFQEKRVENSTQHGAGAASLITPKPDAMNLDTPQQTTNATPKETTADSAPQVIPSDPETRKHFIQEKASLLRTRLQSAMRHVKDPQIDRRVSELEEHSRKYPRLSGSTPATGSGSALSSGTNLQRHLEQKYGKDTQDEQEKEEDEDMLSTPRAQQHQKREEQRDVIRIELEDEVTPTQTQTTRLEPSSYNEQMVLSSPTYNPPAHTRTQSGNSRFDDDRPNHRETNIATSPSSLRGESRAAGPKAGNGDGDAVDGLLKLMGTNSAAAGAGAGTTSRV
ncbi:uncharacterized protein BDV14DRAFT_69395 [Aspergillus stella-maris]|uniref:uncharacterized protein n=1 Tax=Aspergillus stella-maris TaxID=1810926 RepID=UPI003CCD3A35